MSISTIVDTRVFVQASQELLELLNSHKNELQDIPENVAKAMQQKGYGISSKVETIKRDIKTSQLDLKMLRKILKEYEAQQDSTNDEDQILTSDNTKENNKNSNKETPKVTNSKTMAEFALNLNDLKWLYNVLAQLRQDKGLEVYLHNLLEKCALQLPQNEIIERNPVLEARCKKLREDQQNREYLKMTKSVDASLKYYPEDTVAYQLKAINSQIIAVLQFVFSVAAGFAFGFLGIELIIGNLDFGFRLLLGIMCSLIIALAEIYFLAKKLTELDTAADSDPLNPPKRKLHLD